MYDWLTDQMRQKVGLPPSGVIYPVCAWYKQNSRHYKLDLRSERWCYGSNGQAFVCMEIEVPDAQVLLSDFDSWNLVLCNGLLSDTEEESDRLDALYESLAPIQQKEMKYRNRERVFDTAPFANEWTYRGKWVQANFWMLTKDMIRNVRHFKAASPAKPKNRIDT